MAPKKVVAKGRQVAYEGLPEGWHCVEKTYLSGSKAGETYVRFSSDDGKYNSLLSVKAIVKQVAIDKGEDPEVAAAEYEATKAAEREVKAKEREDKGFLKGQKKTEAIEAFRAAHGKLDGATVMQLPGWSGESKILEKCGQISARYYSPTGEKFALIGDIEAALGQKILLGEEIPDIELARNSVPRDEFGKVVNTVRKEESIVDQLRDVGGRPAKKQRAHYVSKEDYFECPEFEVSLVPTAGQAQASSSSSSSQIREALRARGFDASVELLLVTSKSTQALTKYLAGMYYKKPEDFDGKPCYQQVSLHGTSPTKVCCGALHLFWSSSRSAWKVGSLADNKAAWALCVAEDGKGVGELGRGSWELLEPPHITLE